MITLLSIFVPGNTSKCSYIPELKPTIVSCQPINKEKANCGYCASLNVCMEGDESGSKDECPFNSWHYGSDVLLDFETDCSKLLTRQNCNNATTCFWNPYVDHCQGLATVSDQYFPTIPPVNPPKYRSGLPRYWILLASAILFGGLFLFVIFRFIKSKGEKVEIIPVV